MIGIATSCKISYSFTGASIPENVKTVSVKYIETRASLASPTESQNLTEALKDIIISQSNLVLVGKGSDVAFEGEITGYRNDPVAVQGNETAALNKLSVTVNIRFKSEKDEKQNFEQSFSAFAQYNADQNLSTVEDQLLKEINQQLVQDIFNRAFSNW